MGEVSDVFSDKSNLEKLKGRTAIGHTRYSTAGASSLINIQPMIITNRNKPLALAHNGNLTNAYELRKKLDANGSIFQTTSDTEIILHLVAKSKKNAITHRITDALKKIQGA